MEKWFCPLRVHITDRNNNKPVYEAEHNANMSDLLVDFSHLPEDIREKLAELDLELSEGEFFFSYLYEFAIGGPWAHMSLKMHSTHTTNKEQECCCWLSARSQVLLLPSLADRSIFFIYILDSTVCGVGAGIVLCWRRASLCMCEVPCMMMTFAQCLRASVQIKKLTKRCVCIISKRKYDKNIASYHPEHSKQRTPTSNQTQTIVTMSKDYKSYIWSHIRSFKPPKWSQNA